jgi:hypothetical protein
MCVTEETSAREGVDGGRAGSAAEDKSGADGRAADAPVAKKAGATTLLASGIAAGSARARRAGYALVATTRNILRNQKPSEKDGEQSKRLSEI